MSDPGATLERARACVRAIIAGTGGSTAPPRVAVAAIPRRPLRSLLRPPTQQRTHLTAIRRWHSRQRWTGPLAFSSERSLVVAAADAVSRIASSPAWTSGRLEEHRARMDLAAELDQLDAEAHGHALGRNAAAGNTPDESDPAWQSLITRAAALTCYADQLDGSAARVAAALDRDADGIRAGTMHRDVPADEISLDDHDALTFYLEAAVFGQTG